MAAAARSAGIVDWLWLLGCGLFGTTIIVSASDRIGVTFDETFYLNAGLKRWHTGSTSELMHAGTMPLPVDVETLPVYIAERWRGRPWNLATEFHPALALARRGTLVFWWLVLLYGWRIGSAVGGPWAGRLAAAVLAAEPTLLGHAGLATTDVALTACVLAFCFHYARGRDAGWRGRVGLPGVLYGLAVLAKASGMVFVPLCMAAIEFERRWRASSNEPSWPRLKGALGGILGRPYLRESAIMFALAMILTYTYCGSDWQPHPKLVGAAHALADGPCRRPAIRLAENFRVFNNAGVGLWCQIKHNMNGHGAYLLGGSWPRAVWYYFPTALSIKTPAVLLIAPLLLLVFARHHLANWPLFAALVLLGFSLTCRVQIGVRMQLPLIALASVGLSAAGTQALAMATVSLQRIGVFAAAAGVVWLGLAAVQTWPHHLTFVNEFWGGPEQGERLLSDSNFDWGQGLPDLAAWAGAEGLADVPVWYFGTDPAVRKSPFRLVPLHTAPIGSVEELRSRVGARYLAVSTTLAYGGYTDQAGWLVRHFRGRTPTARTRTFLIFDLEQSAAGGQITSGVGIGPSISSKTPMRRNFW